MITTTKHRQRFMLQLMVMVFAVTDLGLTSEWESEIMSNCINVRKMVLWWQSHINALIIVMYCNKILQGKYKIFDGGANLRYGH